MRGKGHGPGQGDMLRGAYAVRGRMYMVFVGADFRGAARSRDPMPPENGRIVLCDGLFHGTAGKRYSGYLPLFGVWQLGGAMTGGFNDDLTGAHKVRKHPFAGTIEDVITFRLNLLVAIGERAGHHWSERLFDLSLNEWRMLALIKARAPCRAGNLADLLLMDKSQTSRVIKSLLRKELIVNLPDPDDGRAIALNLTQKGETLYERVFAEVLDSNERILATLSEDEVAVFDKVLGKLVNHSQDLLERRLGRKIIR